MGLLKILTGDIGVGMLGVLNSLTVDICLLILGLLKILTGDIGVGMLSIDVRDIEDTNWWYWCKIIVYRC